MKNNKYALRKAWALFCENMTFMLTLIITYIFAAVFIYFSWDREVRFSKDNLVGYKEFLEIMIGNLIPTTLVYVLGCIIANIVDITTKANSVYAFNIERNGYPYNVITIVSIVLYALVYCIYMTRTFSILGVIVEIILTIVLLILNLKSHKEMYRNCARSIS